MKQNGFTLHELMITLAIIAIALSIATPAFNKTIQETRTKTAALALLDAIETTRSTAVFHNQRTILIATNQKWHDGWRLFVDENNNGTIDQNEHIMQMHEPMHSVFTIASDRMESHILFIGTGEGRQLSTGGFLSGNIKICPKIPGEGYKLMLSKGGRTRVEKLSSADCETALEA